MNVCCRTVLLPPPVSFHDMALEPGRAVKESDWPALEANAKKFSKEKQPFERLEVSKAESAKTLWDIPSMNKMHFVEMFVPETGLQHSLPQWCFG